MKSVNMRGSRSKTLDYVTIYENICKTLKGRTSLRRSVWCAVSCGTYQRWC